jgi:hypothetical protein
MRTSTSLATTVTALALASIFVSGVEPAVADDPALGATTYYTYEAFLSPAQEGGEESEIPKPLEKSLGSTKPSTPRAQRKSRGWGRVRFTKDLTKAIVDFEMKGVDPADIVMFHIHCGVPGMLGPIVVDFSKKGSLPSLLASGKLSVDVANEDLTYESMIPKGLKLKLPESCPVEAGLPGGVKTIGGLEYLARKGVLYFNLHTKQHTYYGEMRGQLHLVP